MHGMENETGKKEQDNAKELHRQEMQNSEKYERMRVEEERQREVKRLEEERVKADKVIQERLRKESELRRRRQNELKERARELQEQRNKEMLDKHVGGETDGKVEELFIKGRQLDIQANREGKGAKKEQPYKQQEREAMARFKEYEKSVSAKVELKMKAHSKEQEAGRER